MMTRHKKTRAGTRAFKRRRSVYDGLETQKLARKKDGDQYKSSDWDADLQKQIDSPAPITGRNNEMISLASKMIWANHRLASDSEILFSFFRERYSSDVTDAEIRSAIKSARKYNSTTREDSRNSFGEARQREKVVSQKSTKKYNPKKVSKVSLEEIDFFGQFPIATSMFPSLKAICSRLCSGRMSMLLFRQTPTQARHRLKPVGNG